MHENDEQGYCLLYVELKYAWISNAVYNCILLLLIDYRGRELTIPSLYSAAAPGPDGYI